MNNGISSKAPEKEQIKSDFECLIRGMSWMGEIDSDAYDYLFDKAMPMFDQMFEQGKKEAITWHPYPEEKPPCTDDYLITIKKGRKLCVTKDCYDINEGEFEIEFNTKIIAWAELPEPHQPEVKNETHE